MACGVGDVSNVYSPRSLSGGRKAQREIYPMPCKLTMGNTCLEMREKTSDEDCRGGLCSWELVSAGTSAVSAVQRHIPTIPHLTTIYTHLHSSNTNMSLRKSFSGLKNRLKHRLARGRQEQEGVGAKAGGESVDSVGPLVRPEHHVIAKDQQGRPQSESKVDAAPHSDDSGFISISDGQDDKRGTEAATEGTETSEGGLYLGSGVEHSGPSQGGNRVGREKVDQLTYSHPPLRWNPRVCKLPVTPPSTSDHSSDMLSMMLTSTQRTKANKQAIESLAPRIKALSDSLCTPIPEDDAGEEARRKELEW